MIYKSTIHLILILFFMTLFSFALTLPIMSLRADEASGQSMDAAVRERGDDKPYSYTVADEGGGEGDKKKGGGHHDKETGENGASAPHVNSEAGNSHTHIHGEGEIDNDCLTCTEYWHEPWRMADQYIQWMHVKMVKILIFAFLCYLFLKRRVIFSLFSGRKGSGRSS